MAQQNQPQEPGTDGAGYGWANSPGYGRPDGSQPEPQGYAPGQQFGSAQQYGQPTIPSPQYGQAPQYGTPPSGQYGDQYPQQPYGTQPQPGQPQYGQTQYGQSPYGMPPVRQPRPVWKTVLGVIFAAIAGLFTLGAVSSAAQGNGPSGSGAAYLFGYIMGVVLMIGLPALFAWLLLRRK